MSLGTALLLNYFPYLLLLMLCSWLPASHALPLVPQANKVVLRLGMYHNPPYYYTEGVAEPHGLSLDLLKPAARQLGYEIQVVTCPFPRCLKMAEQGEIDIVAGLIKSPAREQFLHFMQPAMMRFRSSFVFYAHKDNQVRIHRLSELRNHSVAVMREAVYYPEFDGASFIHKVEMPSEAVSLDMVHKRRVDFAITVERTAGGSFREAGLLANDFVKQPYHVQQVILGYLAFSRASPNFQYAGPLESMLEKQYQTGLFHLLWQKYQLPTSS